MIPPSSTSPPSPYRAAGPDLQSIYSPVLDDLKAVRKLFQETILESPERRHLHEILIGENGDVVPGEFRVEVVERITRHLIQAEGKWHRAAMTLLSAAMFGSRGVPVHQVAAAVELVHLSTLIHDDIIDEAEVRRGQKTVSSGWGNSIAVLLGDFLFCRAFKLLLASESVPSQTALTIATGQMCLGEIKQLGHSHQLTTTERDYMEMIGHKTAALMAAATAAGGYLAGVDEDLCGRLDHLGYTLGMAFQITDDVLDYRSNVSEMGKEAGGDLRNGKLTLPLIRLLALAPEMHGMAQASFNDPVSAERLREAMLERGCHEYAFEMAQRYLEEAHADIRYLRKRGGTVECIDAFEDFIQFILTRDR